MSYAYHGNYCGPGWSAGAYRNSVVSRVEAVDDFDRSCRAHDATYATGGDRVIADRDFAYENVTSLNPKRMVAGLLVGAQGVLRYAGVLEGREAQAPSDQPLADENQTKILTQITTMTKQKQLRPRHPVGAKTARASGQPAKLAPSVRIDRAPVSMGNTITASRPISRSTPTGVIVTGREFLCQVYETSNTNFQLSALAPLHPAFYPASTMGTLARAYRHYRFRRASVHFITRQPTSVTGEICLAYSATVTEPCENGAASTFLPRVMTRGEAIIGPLWVNHTLDIKTDGIFRLVDCFTSSDINQQICGEVQAYTLSGVTDTAGYLIMDYELELNTTMFTAHSTAIPLSSGPGASYTLADSSTTPTALNAVQVTNSSMTAVPNGTIWKMIVNADESTPATGTTLANAWQTTINYGATTTTTSSTVTTLTVTDGMLLYGVVVGSSLYVYSTYDEAISGVSTGQLFYRTTGSTAASWLVNSYIIRLGPVITSAVQ